MNSNIKRRLAAFGLAATAVLAIQGTAFGSGGDAATCDTWHPVQPVAGQPQHTWNPAADSGEQHHLLNPDGIPSGQYQHTLNPDGATPIQHSLNPVEPGIEQPEHSWNPSTDPDAGC